MAASSTCSCPCVGSVDPTRVAGFAAGVGATVAWYALPDYVRSRPLRGLVKAGLLGMLGWDKYDGKVEFITELFPSSGTGQVNAVFPLPA